MKPNQNVEACAQSTDQSPRLLWAEKWMWLIPEEFRCSKKVTDFLAFHIRNSTFRCGSMTPKITWYQSTGAFSLLHYKDPQTHFDWHPIFVTSQGLWTQVTQGIWGEEYGTLVAVSGNLLKWLLCPSAVTESLLFLLKPLYCQGWHNKAYSTCCN